MTDWTFVQTTSGEAAGSATGAQTFSAAITSGNIILGGALWSPDSGGNIIDLVSVVDDKGNSLSGGQYQMTVYSSNIGLDRIFCFMSTELLTNGPSTVTITLSAAPASFFFRAFNEFKPPTGCTAVSLDGTVTTIDAANTNTSSAPFQNINNDALIFGFSVLGGPQGSGFTIGTNDGPNNVYTEFLIQATPTNTNVITWGTATNFFAGFGVAPVANTGWVPVQWAQVGTPTNVVGTSVTVSFVNPVTPGNMVTSGFGAIAGGTTLVSIVDNLGANYTSDLVFLDSLGHGFWWTGGPISTTPQSFTLTRSASGDWAVTIVEFRPPTGFANALLDGSPADGTYNGGPNITTLTTPAITTTRNNSLVYAWISTTAVEGDIPTDGFSILNNPYLKNSDAYWIQTTPGSVTSTWDFDSGNAIALFAIGIRAVHAFTLSAATGNYVITGKPQTLSEGTPPATASPAIFSMMYRR